MAVSMIKNVTFELLLHAAFVADEIWGFMLEPARTALPNAIDGNTPRQTLKCFAGKQNKTKQIPDIEA